MFFDIETTFSNQDFIITIYVIGRETIGHIYLAADRPIR